MNKTSSETIPIALKRRGNSHATPEIRIQQIVAAAARCFGEKGYYRTTMDEIVSASGLSKGSLYRFYQSKDDLLMAIADNWFQTAQQGLTEFDAKYPPLMALKNYCLFTIRSFCNNDELFGLWGQFSQHPEAREKLQQLHQYERKGMQRILAKAKRDGELLGTSPMDAADHLRAILEGVMMISTIDPSISAEKKFLRAWPLFVAGLK